MFDDLLDWLFAEGFEHRGAVRFEEHLDQPLKITVRTILVAGAGSGVKPYETGIKHPLYNDGRWICVAAYDTPEEARAGHDRWVQDLGYNPSYHIDIRE